MDGVAVRIEAAVDLHVLAFELLGLGLVIELIGHVRGRIFQHEAVTVGLADLDQLERKIPETCIGLEEFDPCAIPRQKIQTSAPALPEAVKEALASYLGECAATVAESAGTEPHGPAHSVIFFSADELMSYAVTTVCKGAGFPVFATNEEQDLDPILLFSLTHQARLARPAAVQLGLDVGGIQG